MDLRHAIEVFNSASSDDCYTSKRVSLCSKAVIASLIEGECLAELEQQGVKFMAVTPIGYRMGMARALPPDT